MHRTERRGLRRLGAILALLLFPALAALPALAADYDSALKGVKGIKAVYDVSVGAPKAAKVIFWAVRNSYQDKTVQALPEKPQVAVVFHGPAVKLVSAMGPGLDEGGAGELAEFQEMLRQMKKEGVKLEVCLYAVRMMGVDPATILPEIDPVGNGFISVIGYQAQGYAVVRLP